MYGAGSFKVVLLRTIQISNRCIIFVDILILWQKYEQAYINNNTVALNLAICIISTGYVWGRP